MHRGNTRPHLITYKHDKQRVKKLPSTTSSWQYLNNYIFFLRNSISRPSEFGIMWAYYTLWCILTSNTHACPSLSCLLNTYRGVIISEQCSIAHSSTWLWLIYYAKFEIEFFCNNRKYIKHLKLFHL